MRNRDLLRRLDSRLERMDTRLERGNELMGEAREESRAVVQAIFKLVDKLDRRLSGNGPALA